MDHPIRYQPLHVPRADRQALIQPPLDQVAEILSANRAALGKQDRILIADEPLAEMRARAQWDLFQAAQRYTASYRKLPSLVIGKPSGSLTQPPPIILSGHQPELFHPGVWFKNFALSQLGQQHQAIAINLIIDSDAVKQTSIPVPTGTVSEPHREFIAYDKAAVELPHEERRVLDPELFASFGNRAAEAISPLVADPLINNYWPLVLEQVEPGKSLGEILSQARHRLEGNWGLKTLEIPQSLVCQLPAYYLFTAHLLIHSDHLFNFYNQALVEYRQVHNLRSPAQPLPQLSKVDGWREMPYWCWTKENPQRRPLFTKQRGNEILLTNRAGWEARLGYDEDTSFDTVESLIKLQYQGVKLRTRALATTMFARLILSDLFLHGIGGAKYDQVTDRLIGLFFNLPAPKYLTLTATVKLPIDRPHVVPSDATRLRVRLRELRFTPERFIHMNDLPTDAAKKEAQALIAEKQRWINTKQTPQNASTRHFEITKASSELQPLVQSMREKLQAEQELLARQLQAESVLGSREYAFCLYEATTLRNQLLEFLSTTF